MSDLVEIALRVLNEAFELDPAAIHALCANRVPCNRKLAEHPTIIVGDTPLADAERFDVGALGILNGIIEAATGRRIGMRWEGSDVGYPGPRFTGFVEWQRPKADAGDVTVTASVK